MKKRMWGQSLKTFDIESGVTATKKNPKPLWRLLSRRNVIFLVFGIFVLLYVLFYMRPVTPAKVQHSANLTAVLPSTLSLPLSDADLRHLNAALALLPLPSVLVWICQVFSHRVIQVTSFGLSGLVLLDHFDQLGLLPSVPVITIDTLHLFPETYLLIARVRKRYPGMDLTIANPKGFYERSKFDAHYGADLWQTDPTRYGLLTKVEPLQSVFNSTNFTVWITGRRRSHGGERAKLELLERDLSDPTGNRLKLNPLAHWSLDQVWQHIRTHHVPYNALHDKGYASIGDVMTTRPVKEGDGEREGRFVGQNKSECGMHTHLAKVEQMKEAAKQEEEVFEMPHLPCDDCIEVTKSNFESVVVRGGPLPLLVEFYSPMCSYCQAFAPKFAAVATKLKGRATTGRMDITIDKIPPIGEQVGFAMTGFPTVYLVKYSSAPVTLTDEDTQQQQLTLSKYEGETETDALLEWVDERLLPAR